MVAERPDLFDPETGMRLGHYNASPPEDIPGARRVDVAQTRRLIGAGAAAIDVSAPAHLRDPATGGWPQTASRETIPNTSWLPGFGEGLLLTERRRYLERILDHLTEGDRNRPVVVFSDSSSWRGWNAARRLSVMGYANVNWFPEGVSGWRERGWAVVLRRPATPHHH